ncbi:MAG: hypothetical protein WCI74_05895 [Actinomycetes bacterium]
MIGSSKARSIVVAGMLMGVSIGVVGCSSNTTSPSASPSASQTASVDVATCQKLATILAPYFTNPAFSSMPSAEQKQTLQTMANELQTAANTASPQLQAKITKLQTDVAALIPEVGVPAASASPSAIKMLDQFPKVAYEVTSACQAVGVKVGA